MMSTHLSGYNIQYCKQVKAELNRKEAAWENY